LLRRRTRTRSREAGAALAAALLLAGCGSGGEQRSAPPPPRLPAPLAAQLASRSDEVARLLDENDGCGALAAATTLQRDTIAAINKGRVPARFQEPLVAATNDLAGRIHCVPSPPPSQEHGKGKGKHGKGKHGHDGDGD
jgi:hypothetical protein